MSTQILGSDRACQRTRERFGLGTRGIALGSDCLDRDEIAEAERVLGQSADHRVLRRVPPISAWRLASGDGARRRALFVDVKTTGPSIETDEIMEFTTVAFDYDIASGEMVSASAPLTFEGADAPEIEALADETQLVIAHDAAFVRPMVEKCCPTFARKNWASSLEEIDWASEGLASVRVDDLLMRLGWFSEGFDGESRARAGAFLMTRTLPRSGALVLRTLLQRARRTLFAVRAPGTAFEAREALKQRGYRWDSGAGIDANAAWWILTEDPEVEIAWLNGEIYRRPRTLAAIPMPASRRYSARMWQER